jgi:transposase
MGALLMSEKERRRMGVLSRVKAGLMTLKSAALLLCLSYRQVKRIWKRYRDQGDAGLVHRGRGRISNRRKDAALRQKALELCRTRYAGFGPTLAAEHLAADDQVAVDHETLRRWMLKEGLWEPRKSRAKHRAWRERRGKLGELVQMDGSEHDWFEGRGARAVLMVMIDDATNRTYARFYPAEDTAAAFDVFGRYARREGLPQSLYVDRDSIYRTERQARIDEELRDEGALTQFKRAMKQLGVELILANSPQAKGRVERRHGVFQDRLIKEMRLRGIQTIRQANDYLDNQRAEPQVHGAGSGTAEPASADSFRPASGGSAPSEERLLSGRVVGHNDVAVVVGLSFN